MSALVSRASWVRIPPESPVDFSTDTQKAFGLRAKIKSIVYYLTQEFHQLMVYGFGFLFLFLWFKKVLRRILFVQV